MNQELIKKQEIHAQEMSDYEIKMQKTRELQSVEIGQYQERINKQLANNAIELKDYGEKMKEKAILIQSENVVYKNLIASKKKLDDEYFARF